MEAYQLLEDELADFTGMPYNVVCSSGTAALHISLEVVNTHIAAKPKLVRDDRLPCIAIPDLSMIACTRAATLAQLRPVFIDCLWDFELCWKSFEKAQRDQRLEALMLVHVYGNREWQTTEELIVIEDMAELHGCKPHPSTTAACWSFYRNKVVHGEEGGCVGFRNEEDAKLARQLRSLGFTDKHDFRHIPRGHNYRMSNLHAEPIRQSLKELPSNLYARWERWSGYYKTLPEFTRMRKPESPWVYAFRVQGMDYEKQEWLVNSFQAEGIAARCCFKPCSSQEEYRSNPVYGSGVAARLSQEVCYLPVDPGLDLSVCERAAAILSRLTV